MNYSNSTGMTTFATATIFPDFNSTLTIKGTALFSQNTTTSSLSISLSLTGLLPNTTHGWHIHSNPGVGKNCSSTGGHYNPFNTTHGSPLSNVSRRHYGDLGNFVTDAYGNVKMNVTDKYLSLFGRVNISGLGVVIHEKKDDLGLGGNPESLKTGNAGSRLACGNIILTLSTPSLNYSRASANVTRTTRSDRTALPTNRLSTPVGIYGQCGGIGYIGSTACDAGLRCQVKSAWFSQCLQ